MLQGKLHASLLVWSYGYKIVKKLGEKIKLLTSYYKTKIRNIRVIYTTQ